MHAYSYSVSSESDERISVFYKIAWLTLWVSVIIYFCFLHWIQPILSLTKEDSVLLGFLFTSPSALGLFHLLYKNTSSKWWRIPFWRWAFGITAPNLNGRWIGECVTYYPDGTNKLSKKVELTVLQDWRTICIGINGNLHKSESIGAGIRRVSDGWIVHFQYLAVRKLKKPSYKGVEAAALEDDTKLPSQTGRDPLAHQTHLGAARLFLPDPEYMCPEAIKLQFLGLLIRY